MNPRWKSAGPLGLSTLPGLGPRGRCRRPPPRFWWSACAATLPGANGRDIFFGTFRSRNLEIHGTFWCRFHISGAMVINGSTNPKMDCHVFPAERRLLRNLPEIPKSICTQDPAMSKCGFNTCSKICRKICSWGLICYPAKWCGYGSRHMEPPDKNKPKIAGKWEAHPPYIYMYVCM